MVPMERAWQAERAQSFPDPVTDKWEQDGLVVPFTGDRVDLVPYGWADALRGRYVRRYGEGLHSIPWMPEWKITAENSHHRSSLDVWRYVGFAMWDRKRVEALKGLKIFEGMCMGWMLSQLSTEEE